jgi:hypothetical protein
MRFRNIPRALGVFVTLAPLSIAGAQSRWVQGISFSVDTSADMTPQGPGVVRPPAMRVTYAAGRGRVEILTRPQRAALKIGDVVVAPFLATPSGGRPGSTSARPCTRLLGELSWQRAKV